MSEEYKKVLEELDEVLESGGVALDFEDMPSAATTLHIISDIVGNALRGIKTVEELKKILDKAYGDEDKQKELSK
tara:strand:+ start:50 stop:274 length:225 start_codon:yes stop_codon:yes gene_type:complete